MSDISIFIFGMFVFGVAIASSLIAAIGTSQPKLNFEASKSESKDAHAVVGDTLTVATKPL